MKFGLTPEMAEANYEYLRTSRPFRRMKLPDPDDLAFIITPHVDRYGHFKAKEPGKRRFHEIAISDQEVTSSALLTEVMAHEMIHLFQEINGTDSRRVQHNAEFRRIARTVCRIHAFDPTTFL